MRTETCVMCACTISERNTLGLNKKMLGRQTKQYYCMSCLADFLGLTQEELEDRIEEFKEQGCKLFD